MLCLIKNTFLSVSLLLLSQQAICAADESPATAPSSIAITESIQPRNVGATWLYKSYMFYDGVSESGGTSQESIVDTLTIDGITCYKVQLLIDYRTFGQRISGMQLSPDDYSYYWEFSDTRGSHNFDGEDDDMETPTAERLDQFELTLPYPVEVGYSYEAEGSQYTVLSIDESIEVPAGTFKCVVYQSLSDNEDYKSRQRLYMSPGVGLIRWEEDEAIGDGWSLSYRDDLAVYQLNLPEAAAE